MTAAGVEFVTAPRTEPYGRGMTLVERPAPDAARLASLEGANLSPGAVHRVFWQAAALW